MEIRKQKTMSNRKIPNIVLEKINLERFGDFYEAMVESDKELFDAGIPVLSRNEWEQMVKEFIALWEKDSAYVFYILDGTNKQIVGIALLNQIYRLHQIGNLAYIVRTSRTGEGIATEAARLAALYGFEKLGLQRIEIVVHKDNVPSLLVAQRLGAMREGLLRNRVLLHGIPSEAYLHSLIPADFGIKKTA
jgi:ribosomal-protein-serine acetyltransferase